MRSKSKQKKTFCWALIHLLIKKLIYLLLLLSSSSQKKTFLASSVHKCPHSRVFVFGVVVFTSLENYPPQKKNLSALTKRQKNEIRRLARFGALGYCNVRVP